ncbi:DNA repair protein [Kockiozyma suomiensis]|uniref:DNA repair protein n=1 Tax=Kockiozyma suomiensis TaxID=1337062 RepID=UPI0033434561
MELKEKLESECEEASKQLKNPNAGQTVKRHIDLLKGYNAIRDIGLGLLGMIADTKGLRVAEVMKEYGVDLKD